MQKDFVKVRKLAISQLEAHLKNNPILYSHSEKFDSRNFREIRNRGKKQTLVLLFQCILFSVSTARSGSILFSGPLSCLKIKFMPKNTMEHMIWIILYDLYNMTHII